MIPAGVVLLLFLLFLMPVVSSASEDSSSQMKTIRILATSDLHGKFGSWNYGTNTEDLSGSLAQLKKAIDLYRTDASLLLDAGDTIQGNCADLFVHEDIVHPMVQGMNELGYDVWVTGNHDYNYGMDVVRKTISDMDAKVLTGNVYDESGKPIADGCSIFEMDGVRVAVIGMVTPNIVHWDEKNLKDCKVTDPLYETRKIIDEIQGQYDVLIGAYHMGLNNEYGTADSGVTDICDACPEFDLMISSHDHKLIPSAEINGVITVQNKQMAKTMMVIDINVEKKGDFWETVQVDTQSVMIKDYEPDADMIDLLRPYHEIIMKDQESVIGILEEGPLIPGNPDAEIAKFIPLRWTAGS